MKKQNTGRQKKNHYLEREISWLYFNHRVLQEAQDKTVPLLERLSFLGIYSDLGGYDGYFRSPLHDLVAWCVKAKKADELLKRIAEKRQQKFVTPPSETEMAFFSSLKKELEEHNIYILDEQQINDEQREQIKQIFTKQLSFHLYPRIFLKNANFRDINDENTYLAVRLLTAQKRKMYALLEVPVRMFGRFIKLSAEDPDKKVFMLLDDAIRICLPYVFVGQLFDEYGAYSVKWTKDAEMDIDIHLGDVIKQVSVAVKNRKWGQPVRFTYDKEMPTDLLKQIQNSFNIRKADSTTAGSRYRNLKDLMSFPDCGKELKYPAWSALLIPDLIESESVIEVIKKQDFLLHYPYHSFSNYLRLLREAAISKDVYSIKITLYRLANNSSVAEALICAAKNRKKVTVVIELLARFDEASNIYWTQKMQDAGINVVLGIEGL